MNRYSGSSSEEECMLTELGWRAFAELLDESGYEHGGADWGYDKLGWIQEVWHYYF